MEISHTNITAGIKFSRPFYKLGFLVLVASGLENWGVWSPSTGRSSGREGLSRSSLAAPASQVVLARCLSQIPASTPSRMTLQRLASDSSKNRPAWAQGPHREVYKYVARLRKFGIDSDGRAWENDEDLMIMVADLRADKYKALVLDAPAIQSLAAHQYDLHPVGNLAIGFPVDAPDALRAQACPPPLCGCRHKSRGVEPAASPDGGSAPADDDAAGLAGSAVAEQEEGSFCVLKVKSATAPRQPASLTAQQQEEADEAAAVDGA